MYKYIEVNRSLSVSVFPSLIHPWSFVVFVVVFSSLEFFCFGSSQRGFRPLILLDPKMTSSTDFKLIQRAVHVETLDAILVSGFAFVKNFFVITVLSNVLGARNSGLAHQIFQWSAG